MGQRKSLIGKNVAIHKTALVAKTAVIGSGSTIWAYVQIGDNAVIGENCVIGNAAYVDRNVIIGNNVKIHNKAMIYRNWIIEDNCFIGPGTIFTNDKFPRHNSTRDLKKISWRFKKGSSVGANCTILPDINIGKNVLIGAGSVVTRSLPDNSLTYGNPAKTIKINKK